MGFCVASTKNGIGNECRAAFSQCAIVCRFARLP